MLAARFVGIITVIYLKAHFSVKPLSKLVLYNNIYVGFTLFIRHEGP